MIHLNQSTHADDLTPFDLRDRGLLLADGVFDTSLIMDGRCIFRGKHLARLLRDASALDLPVTESMIDAFIDKVIPDGFSGALRITLTRGPGGRGLAGGDIGAPTLLAHLTPDDSTRRFAPVSLTFSDLSRNPNSLTSRHKTLAYVDNVMAMRRAHAAGFEDAIMTGTSGAIACSTCANLFVRSGNVLRTPPISDGALPGVLRGWVLKNAGKAGLRAEESTLTVSDLETAEQVFLTNSLRLIAPVSRIGDKRFDTALPSELKALLVAAITAGDPSD